MSISRISEYQLSKTILRIIYSDITKLKADVLVSSDDNYLSMGGGVSYALSRAAGELLRKEARKLVPLKIGDVAVTSAGNLAASYVFHAVTIDYTNLIYPSEESIRSSTLKCLQLADTLQAKSIAFPALGTGVGGFPFQMAADVMMRTIADYIMGKTKIEVITLTLFPRKGIKDESMNIFYERVTSLAAVYTQAKRLNSLVSELETIIGGLNEPSLSEILFKLKSELQSSQEILSKHPENLAEIEQMKNTSRINEISGKLVDVSSKIMDTTVDNKQLEANILRTRLSGLYTQLNIQEGNLNHLEIDKAKYGPVGIPPILINNINDIKKEREIIENKIKEIREKLIALGFND